MKYFSLGVFVTHLFPFVQLVLGQTIVKRCGTLQPVVLAKDATYRFSYLQYPKSYSKNLKCTWNFRTVTNCALSLNCTLSIPCQGDQLRVSNAGNLNAAASVTNFCGNRTARVTSVANAMSVNLRSSANSRGGTMLCRLISQSVARTTTTAGTTSSRATTTTATTITTTNTTSDNDSIPSCKCGIKGSDQRIVGGDPAGQTEYPWQVMVVLDGYVSCGGSVIAPSWVVTAAHCTYGYVASNFAIAAGRYNISQQSSTSQYVKVKRIVQHEAYSRSNVDNDISLLELESPLSYTNAVQPICLPYNYATNDFQNHTVIATGWGTTSYGGSISMILLKVSLPVLTTDECRSYYGAKYITDNMFCTYSPGKDACQGDSGGPINWIDASTGRVYMVGIVSWGDGCADVGKPGVITKVTNYLDWVKQKTGEEFCTP